MSGDVYDLPCSCRTRATARSPWRQGPRAVAFPTSRGYLIEVDEAAGFVNVIDIKTARSRWSPENVLEHSSQLELYRLAVEPMVNDIGLPIRLGFEVVSKTKVPTVERHYVTEVLEPAERQVRVVTLVLEAIERGIFIPSPSWACTSCPFREPCRRW